MKALVAEFGGDLIVLSSKGYANIVFFKSKAANVVRLVSADEDGADDYAIKRIGKQVASESIELELDKNSYQTRITRDIADQIISPTLLKVLSSISPKLCSTLPALMIGNIISSVVTDRPTTLQISLGVLLRDKRVLDQTYQYRITCSYDEMLRFKSSAAVDAAKKPNVRGLIQPGGPLIQAVADNFDANISSQNGLKSTHALALLLTQNVKGETQSAHDGTITHIP